MTVNRTYKILLLQLPGAEFVLRGSYSIPLAAGYLKAMAYKEGLLDQVDIEILDLDVNITLPGSARLIDLIISKSPEVLCLSLYSWNSIQSLFIAEEVKKKITNIKVIVGGPEVTLNTKYILNNRSIDIGCIGQGEFTFVEIVKNILNGKKDYANIKGIFYRKSGEIIITPPRQSIKELDQIPSPYILGFIKPKNYGSANIETYRGCFFKCSYCAHWIRNLGYFSANRICEELKVILRSGAKEVFIMDSAFVLTPNFNEICGKIKEINSEGKLKFFTNAFAEHINKERADLLKECNFKSLELGLQSINQLTLRNVNRPPLKIRKFLDGIKLLEERKIQYRVGVIIGLPNETIQDFKKTISFLRDRKIPIIFHLLQVFPGTSLEKEATKYGIRYQKKPPYFIIETPYISKNEIEEAINLSGKFDLNFTSSLISYSKPQYPQSQKNKACENFFKTKQLNNGINKVILKLNSFSQTADQLEMVGKRLSRVVSQEFAVWFKTRSVEKNLNLLQAFCLPIATVDPFLVWNITLESNEVFATEVIKKKYLFKREVVE
jgi:radical SAM superfamily enzyme YgiQ (UPF0313 family)